MTFDPSAKYFFVHVPKTGGTSLFRWLASIYGADKCCEHIEALVLPEPGPDVIDYLRKFHVIGGHVPIDWWQFFAEFGFTPITIVRNPLDQFYSHVNHLLSQDLSAATNRMLPIIKSKLEVSVGHFLETGTADELFFFESSQSKPIFGSSFPWRTSAPDERRSWLQQTYSAVMTTEAMDEELRPRINGYTAAHLAFPKENVSTYRKEALTSKQKALLAKLLRQDIELYKLAVEISQETVFPYQP